jgi:uncharacterized protein (DUF4415 family)
MKKKIIQDDNFYTDAPSGVNEILKNGKRISDDFLPSPSEIAKMKRVVTIRLDADTIDFFKTAAAQNGTQYQPLINDLLREYVRQHRKAM